jgi:hypothetical protein
MPSLPTVTLDPNHPEREVDLIMDDDHITNGDLSKREKCLQRLAASVHKGLGLNQTPRPITYSKRPLAVSVSLKPTRASKATGYGDTSMRTADCFDAATIRRNRSSAQGINNGENDIVSGSIVTSARITKTYDGLKSGAHDRNLETT